MDREAKEQAIIAAQREAVKVATAAKALSELEARRGSDGGVRAITAQTSPLRSVEGLLRPGALFVSSAIGNMDQATIDAAEVAVRLTAAQLGAGRTEWVFETAVGQSVWLSALALHLLSLAESAPPKQRLEYIGLALRAQGACAKLVLSIGAMATMNRPPAAESQ
ncbi:MAG: hypothetical protein ABIF28_07920 [Pseudomonadota bacterium]